MNGEVEVVSRHYYSSHC